jgi:hypothetical protein
MRRRSKSPFLPLIKGACSIASMMGPSEHLSAFHSELALPELPVIFRPLFSSPVRYCILNLRSIRIYCG